MQLSSQFNFTYVLQNPILKETVLVINGDVTMLDHYNVLECNVDVKASN